MSRQNLTIGAVILAILVAGVVAFGKDIGLYGTAADQCANIDGDQGSIPEGMIQDGENCIPDPNVVAQADSDNDGVLDANDACPNQGDQGYGLDGTGCPNPPPPADTDGDGITDDVDACPNQGDQGFGLDATGCPVPPPADTDGDGITDDVDACPNEGDQGNGVDATGCPILALAAVPGAVNAGFEASIGADGTVQFTDTTTITGELTIASWAWTFGDGGTSTEQNPSHQYAAAGTFDATLTVTASDGTTSTASGQVTITEEQIEPMRCSFSIALMNEGVPLTANFTNESTNVTSYAWDFGDGSTSSDINPSHVYNAVGTYNIVLTCTGTLGTLTANGQVSVTETVVETPLTAQFTANPSSGAAPLSVQFTDTSLGNVTGWSWNFGDGETSSSRNPSHTYAAVGTYTVTLTITGQDGQTVSASGTVDVLVQPTAPSPNFSASPRSGNAPLTVTVTDTSVGTITSWSWNFGDGTGTASGPGPHQHTYAAEGTFTITLTVGGPNGGGTATKQIVVIPSGAVVDAKFSYQLVGAVTGGYRVCFTDESVGTVTNRAWTFGDPANGSSSDQNPCYVYAEQGNYPATLAVTGTGGETSTASQLVSVYAGLEAPKANFSVNSTSVEVGQQVTTVNQSTGVITSFAWDFGDGSTSDAENPTHTYAAMGTFTITLRVTGPGGTSEAAATQVTVGLPEVSCQISGASTANYFDTKTYSATVSGLGGRAATYEWTFNGQTSTGESFSQQFTQVGSFPLSLNVMFEGEVLCTATRTITVNQDSLTCDFGGDTTPRLQQAVTYTGNSSGLNGRTIASETWTVTGGAGGTGNQWTNTWATAGTYDLTYTVTLSDGTNCERTRAITVSESTVECSISGSTSVNPFETRNYNLSTAGQPSGATYRWTVNGQEAGNSRTISYTFGDVNITYTFTAEVLSGGQVLCTSTRTVTTKAQDALSCSIGGAKDMLLGEVSGLSGNVDKLYDRTATYQWKVGDSVVGTDQNMGSYTWGTSGNYQVTFTVTPSSGSPCVATRTIRVLDTSVTCSISGSSSPRSFITSSWAGNVNSLVSGLTRQWQMDGVGIGTGGSVDYMFTDTNTHTLTLQVFDGATMVCQASKTITARQDDLRCSIDGPNSRLLLQDGQYTASVSNLRGRTATYVWQLGGQNIGSNSSVTTMFNQSGAQTLTLVVTPSDGVPCTATKTVQVAESSLECSINGNFSPFAGQAVAYSASVNGLGDQSATYEWKLNDQIVGSTANLNYTFDAEGSASLVLTVRGSREGVECSVTGAITVQAGQSINATANPNSGRAPQMVTFTAETTNIDRSTLTWYYPDGSFQRAETGTFLFTTEGTYTVRVRGTGVIGQQEASVTVVISSTVGIRAAFTPNPWGAIAPYEICFTDRSASDFSALDSWSWNFGDGVGTSSEQNPCYTYTNTGNYNVTLEVTNTAGLRASASNTVRLYSVSEGQSSFGIELKPGREVCFTSYLGEGMTVDHWDFGDGQTSQEANPCVIFTGDGDFTVTLFFQGAEVPGSISRTIKVSTFTTAELPQLAVTEECTQDGQARFTITNTGGAMSNPDTYAVTDASGTVLASESFLLLKNEQKVITVEGEGVLTLTTTDSQLSTSTECAAPPKLAANGQCDTDNGQVVFTLVNEGGPMTAGAAYTITGSAGELASGTSDILDAGQSQSFTVPAPADGTTVTFNADGLSAPVAVENCAALPKLAASGQCDADNGQVVFTLVNEGGPMTAGAAYSITGSAGELASGTSDVLDAGQSQTFTVPAPADGTTVTFNADGLSAPVAVENCAAPVKASLTILKVVNGQISGPYDFEICVKGPSLDQCVMLRNGASITFEDLEPGVYTVSEPNIGPEWSVIGTGDVELVEGVPASVNVINTPTLCEMSMVNANGELIVAANPALCAPVEVAQVPEPITIELAGTGPVCPDWFVYHTLQTGDVEVFRLGELPDNPDADDNLSKGENADPRLAYDQEPSRSPDSAWVVFASNRTGSWELWRGTTDGERQEQLTFQSGSIEWDPAWSPLGTYIVYDSSRDGNWNLYLLNVETGEERQLTDNDGADINGFWHPDGDKVLFQSNRDGLWQLYVIDIVTGEETRLSDGTGDDFNAQYSSDGTQIAFLSFRNETTNRVLYVSGADGSGAQAISDVNGDVSSMAFSGDDALIAYTSNLADAQGSTDQDIYVYEFESQATRLVTDNAIDDYAPTWRCESHAVIFTSAITGDANVFETPAEPLDADPIDVETEAAQLTFDEEDDYDPQSSPSEENASQQITVNAASR